MTLLQIEDCASGRTFTCVGRDKLDIFGWRGIFTHVCKIINDVSHLGAIEIQMLTYVLCLSI